MTDYKPVHSNIFDPTNTFFKQKANERATSRTLLCCQHDCPLLAQRKCIAVGPFSTRCPYGKWELATGPTKRARSLYSWIEEQRKKHPDVGMLGVATRKMAFIGEYVYLPYSHMDTCKDVPFLAHSAFFVSGTPLVPKEWWHIGTVEKLIDFRPQSMMGPEITRYQKEVVPEFLQHLREEDPKMWAELVERRPELDKDPDYVGRHALLKTLKPGITWTVNKRNYPVKWDWDGETATTSSLHSYNKTWGDLKPGEIELSMKPADDASVEVLDNDWVTKETVFVD